MNCSQVRELLPVLLYGDASAADKIHLEKHVDECADCRREFVALQGVRRLLGVAAPPNVQVDLARLYRASAAQAGRRQRGWRRVALLAAGVAALVAIMAFLRFEAHFQSHQLVLRWGPAPTADTSPSVPAPAASAAASSSMASHQAQGLEDEVQLLSKLIHALADDLQEQDRQHRLGASELLTRLRAIEQQSNRRYVALEKEIESLYRLSQKGE
jgi:hypothetical protein